ncbi:MAG: cation transporter [Proteobacteria bacterium]|nr:cation transporter [Pseudomonadota bacterium]
MLWLGRDAGSAALIGFGLDSLIEIGASTVVLWQLTGTARNREPAALRLIGVCFLALAAYVLLQSGWTLATGKRPAPSPAGMAWLALTCAVMAWLAWAKRATGRSLGNTVLVAEARVTLIDAALAASVLAGIALNAALGWWWADPLAGLMIVVYGAIEGCAALRHARDSARIGRSDAQRHA